MIIGLIGSGKIGTTLARLAIAASHDVLLSNSRGPESLEKVVMGLGPRARAATPGEAAEAGELIVVAIPLGAYRQVPADPLRGKVVIDTNNYYPDRDGHIAELDDESTTTSELLQAHLPCSHVVKAFNNIYVDHLAVLGRPSGDSARSCLPLVGDHEAGKRTASAFLDAIGYDAYDVGRLSEGWRFQRDTPAYCRPYAAPGSSYPTWSAVPAGPDKLLVALSEAKRYRDSRLGGTPEPCGPATKAARPQ